MKLNHISYSGLKLFKTCPFAFLQHYTGKKTLPTDAMNAGKERHKAIEDYINGKDAELSKKLKLYLASYENPESERKFEIEIAGQKIIGFIDLMEVRGNTLYICDFKSNPGAFVDEEQLKLYSYAILQENPFLDVIVADFYYLNQDYYERHTWLAEDVERYGEELIITCGLISELPEDAFEAKAGEHCRYCQHIDACPIANDYNIQRIENDEQGAELAAKVEALESALKKAKEILKEYLLQKEIPFILTGSGKKYSISHTVTMRLVKTTKKDLLIAEKTAQKALKNDFEDKDNVSITEQDKNALKSK